MDLIATAKEALKLAKAVGDIPLQQTIIDLQQQVLELQEKHKFTIQNLEKETESLRHANVRLQQALDRHGDLRKGNDHLWEVKGDAVIDGPFCVTCWEKDHKVLSMVWDENRCDMICPLCKIPLMAKRPPKQWKDLRQANE